MPLAVVKTNLSRNALPDGFLNKVSDFVVQTMKCETKYTMVEIHTDLPMMRGGTSNFMVNMEFHHNDDKITEETKREIATEFAKFLVSTLRVEMERVLVLFFDTRCTTMQMTHL